jgi:RNA polymerase sigma-70 factor (ECF subfamily)
MDDSDVAKAYGAYGGAVYARCWRVLRDKDGARDVTQEVFLRCFGHRLKLRTGRELLGWLYRVATNLCLNQLRDEDLRRRAVNEGDTERSVSSVGPARRLLRDLLADLDERTQAIVVYVYIDGMTHAEAAEVAQVTDRTVRNCLARFQERGRLRLGNDPEPFLREGF